VIALRFDVLVANAELRRSLDPIRESQKLKTING
jgi:hypothetical protein